MIDYYVLKITQENVIQSRNDYIDECRELVKILETFRFDTR